MDQAGQVFVVEQPDGAVGGERASLLDGIDLPLPVQAHQVDGQVLHASQPAFVDDDAGLGIGLLKGLEGERDVVRLSKQEGVGEALVEADDEGGSEAGAAGVEAVFEQAAGEAEVAGA